MNTNPSQRIRHAFLRFYLVKIRILFFSDLIEKVFDDYPR